MVIYDIKRRLLKIPYSAFVVNNMVVNNTALKSTALHSGKVGDSAALQYGNAEE